MIRDFSCLLCLLLFVVSNVINIASILDEAYVENAHYDSDEWHRLDPNFLADMWEQRTVARAIKVNASIFNAVAWFSLIVPVSQAAYLLSEGGSRMIGLHLSIVVLVFGGSLSELLSHMMRIGFDTSIRWMANSFNLNDWNASSSGDDGIGWRVMELLRLMGRGVVVWIDAFEWLALAGITFLVFLSMRNDKKEVPTFTPYFAGLSFGITLFSFINFSSNVYKLTAYKSWVPLTISMTFFNSIILLPMWLYNLSGSIPAAKARFEVVQTERTGEEVEISEIS